MSIGVHGDAIAKKLFDVGSDSFIIFVESFKNKIETPEFSDCHLIFSQSSCLVTANIISPSHGLASCQKPNQVILIFHFSNTVGKRDSHSQRQTFRHSHDNQTYRNDDVLYYFFQKLERHDGVAESETIHDQVET